MSQNQGSYIANQIALHNLSNLKKKTLEITIANSGLKGKEGELLFSCQAQKRVNGYSMEFKAAFGV